MFFTYFLDILQVSKHFFLKKVHVMLKNEDIGRVGL